MYFVSYSRQEFYLAEYLVHDLERHGITVWFDVQELEVGGDWQSDLQRGLDTCSGFILIASRAALDSPYVQQELQVALERAVPIFVVMADGVRLPDHLCQQAQAVLPVSASPQTLARLLSPTDTATPPPVKRCQSSLLDRLRGLHNDVALVCLTLLVSALYHFVGAFGVAWAGSMSRVLLQVVFCSLGIFMLVQAWRFIRRRSAFNTLFNGMLLFNGLGIVSYTQWLYPAALRASSDTFGMSLLTGIVFLLTVYTLWTLRTSAAILRWLPTGEAPPDLRRRFYPEIDPVRLSPRPAPAALRPFAVHAHPNDLAVAVHIRTVLHSAGYRPHDSEDSYHLIVITNNTDVDWLEATIDAYPGFIAIVAGSIALPPQLEYLKRIQWIDYRTHSDVQLLGLMAFFNNQSERLAVRMLNNVPEAMGRLVLPVPVQWMALLLRLAGATAMVVGAVFGLAAAAGLPAGSALAWLSIPAGLGQLALVERWVQRRITILVFAACLLLLGIVIAWATPQIGALMLAVGVVSAFLLLPGIAPVRQQLRAVPWLPTRLYPVRASLNPGGAARIWAVNALTILLGVWAAVYLPQVEAAGLLELASFELGLTGSSPTAVDERLTINPPAYFQLQESTETPDHLDDLGSVVWAGSAVAGLSGQNAVNVRVLRFAPSPLPSNYAITNPSLLIFYSPSDVSIPSTDPAAAVAFLIERDYTPLIEQRYWGYYAELQRAELQERFATSSFMSPSGSFALVRGALPPPEPDREVVNLLRETLPPPQPNVEITRFRYDLQMTTQDTRASTHEWLFTIQSVGADFILQVEGRAEDIQWHSRQIEGLVESLLIDERFRLPAEREHPVGGLIFTVPSEQSAPPSSVVINLAAALMQQDREATQAAAVLAQTDDPAARATAAALLAVRTSPLPLLQVFTDHLATSHSAYYQIGERTYQIRIATLAANAPVQDGAALIAAMTEYARAASLQYWEMIRSYGGDQVSGAATNVLRFRRYELPEVSEGILAPDIAFSRLMITSSDNSFPGSFGSVVQRDIVYALESDTTWIIVWFTNADQAIIDEFFAGMRRADDS